MHYLRMEGNEIFKLAVTIMAEAGQSAITRAGLKLEDINLVIPHQANIRIIMAMAKKIRPSAGKDLP